MNKIEFACGKLPNSAREEPANIRGEHKMNFRECETADDPIYRTCAQLWCAVEEAQTANAPVDRAAVADTVKPIVGCSHDWRDTVDTQFCNETYTEVKCIKCGMVGEKTIATGEVFFPAT